MSWVSPCIWHQNRKKHISFSKSCTEPLYTRMNEEWPRASLHFPERRKGKRQQVNKNTFWSSLPLHHSITKAAVRRMSKFQSVLFFYASLSSISFFSEVQIETNVWWHIWGTLKQPREKEGPGEVKEREKMCAHACLSLCSFVYTCVNVTAFCVLAETYHIKTVQMSRLWLLSLALQDASKRRDFPSLFQISQAVQMGTDVLPK